MQRNTTTGNQIVSFSAANGKQVNCALQIDNRTIAFGAKAYSSIHFFDITNIASPVQGIITASDLTTQCNEICLYDKDHIAVASNGNIIDIYKLSDKSHSTITLTPAGHVNALINSSM